MSLSERTVIVVIEDVKLLHGASQVLLGLAECRPSDDSPELWIEHRGDGVALVLHDVDSHWLH